MDFLLPPAVHRGAVVGVCAPATGVGAAELAQVDQSISVLRAAGYHVEEGSYLRNFGAQGAPGAMRVEELMQMLTNPDIAAVFTPGCGAVTIELLDLLDWARIQASTPKWVFGSADTSTLLTPLTIRAGWVTGYGVDALRLDQASTGDVPLWQQVVELTSGAALRHTAATTDAVTRPAPWVHLTEESDIYCQGRFFGGSVEALRNLTGTPYVNFDAWQKGADDGTVVFLDSRGHPGHTLCAALHGLRLAGLLVGATAVLAMIPAHPTVEATVHREAFLDAFGDEDLPMVAILAEPEHSPVMLNGVTVELASSPEHQLLIQQTPRIAVGA